MRSKPGCATRFSATPSVPRNHRLYISDILEAIGKICRYTEGLSFDEFVADDKTVDAVVRNITVIGEAVRNIPDKIVADNPAVPWAEMRGIRNVVVHEYFGISHRILWDTVNQDLRPLIPLLERMLDA